MKTVTTTILYWYTTVLISVLLVVGIWKIRQWSDLLAVVLFVPILVFLFFKKRGKTNLGLLIYCLLFSTIVLVANVFSFRSAGDLVYAIVFLPIFVFFLQTLKNRPKKTSAKNVVESDVIDDSKRKFLKIATGAGIMGLGMFFLNRKKAQAAFFGSVPGPGTVAVKDSTGAKIDPAMNQPLDGYSISNIDTSTSVHYYGFINRNGDWYIIKEDTDSNTLLYARGDSGYATDDWLTWAGSQNYDYFNAKFG